MSIEFDPPTWAPYAIPSAQGWRHPVTKELLVAIPGGVKAKPSETIEQVIDEKPVVEAVINENVPAAKIITETPVAETVINESPAVEVVIKEDTESESKQLAAQPVKTPTKRGRKPKAR